jgi:hypothetical protein
MENILEWLVPLVFAAIYFFGNMFSSKSDKEDPQTSARGQTSPIDEEAAARQRQIQDEIRRKITERRQTAAGEGPATPKPQLQPGHQGKALRERRKEVAERLEKRREIHEQSKDSQEEAPYLASKRDIEMDEDIGGFSWDESDNVYEQKVQEQLRLVEETKLRAAALRRQTKFPQAGSSARSAGNQASRSSRGGLLSGSVRDVLSNPEAARAAFVYGEVLGKPISLRKTGEGLPG